MNERVRVRASIAPMHAEPRVSSAQISQRLAGHAVAVVAMQGDWCHVRGDDGYEGWMHLGYLDTSPASASESDPHALSLGCVTRNVSTDGVRELPLGAWVSSNEIVTSGDAIDAAARAQAFPREASAIASTAVARFSGTPYQWGGVSPWGADCSGLVQTVFWLHGVSLPRDTWQQAEVGVDAGRETARWRAADLIFFSDREDRRITHVGIALGAARMVHLALGRGGYAVERLDANDDAYVAALMRKLVMTRRVV